MKVLRKLNAAVHMNCRQATEMYSRTIDGSLPLGEKIRFYIHYLACSPCRFYITQIDWLQTALRRYREGSLSGEIPPAHTLSPQARCRIREELGRTAGNRS